LDIRTSKKKRHLTTAVANRLQLAVAAGQKDATGKQDREEISFSPLVNTTNLLQVRDSTREEREREREPDWNL
jgi:hypothetical protein